MNFSVLDGYFARSNSEEKDSDIGPYRFYRPPNEADQINSSKEITSLKSESIKLCFATLFVSNSSLMIADNIMKNTQRIETFEQAKE